MTTSTALESPLPNNRREYFRINDRIGLRITVLNESEFLRLKTRAVNKHDRQHLLNAMIVASESRRAALRAIREVSPAIAHFLADMDEKIDIIANLMAREDSDAPDTQTHDVNLSASGLRFYSDEGYPVGARLELHVHLFPSDNCLRLYGTVVWCERGEKRGLCVGRMAVGVDYADIPSDDRELLFRHINGLQLDTARRGVRASSE